MMIHSILIAHIAVLGYWLGSELVINSGFRFVSRAASMPFEERSRLLDHVMDVDQHVRYALILQAGLGTMLMALLGYLPGGAGTAWLAAALTLAWLVLVELTHRYRKRPAGKTLAISDRGLRYALMAVTLVTACGSLLGPLSLPGWLAVKLILFAGIIGCGLGIRFELIRYFRTWAFIERDGSTEQNERLLRQGYSRATAVLVLLWVFIVAIVLLSVFKP